MALKYDQILTVLVGAAMLGLSVASNRLHFGFHPRYFPSFQKTIVVGGSSNWTFGFDYIDWAFKNSPFFVNDSLVFKYAAPEGNTTRPHNVYLLPDLVSFVNCDLTKAIEVGNETDGAGSGFEFVLNKWQPYYFACGIGNGFHCNNGSMKFFVLPLLHHHLNHSVHP